MSKVLIDHGESRGPLLSLIDEWLEEAEECSCNLRALAGELESLREGCNACETVGSTVAVAGSILSIGAAFFTEEPLSLCWEQWEASEQASVLSPKSQRNSCPAAN
ncbi:hypothetical protein WMY93_001790 [Mugilogobius chulae]|uniref:Uncharacterized protein n=1 Tax=Mugilogobius chulae TaxID=88201 RepID=A0AAW0PV67_9GOBI